MATPSLNSKLETSILFYRVPNWISTQLATHLKISAMASLQPIKRVQLFFPICLFLDIMFEKISEMFHFCPNFRFMQQFNQFRKKFRDFGSTRTRKISEFRFGQNWKIFCVFSSDFFNFAKNWITKTDWASIIVYLKSEELIGT